MEGNFQKTTPSPSSAKKYPSKSSAKTNNTSMTPDILPNKEIISKNRPIDKNAKRVKSCMLSPKTSGTQFFRKENHKETFERITTDQYFGKSESISGSSLSFHCVHGPEGRLYSQKGILKRNLIKELDPIRLDPKWNDKCPVPGGWQVVKDLEFLVCDSVGPNLKQRLDTQYSDLVKISCNGYRVDVLDSVCKVVDFLVETTHQEPYFKGYLIKLLRNMERPILISGVSDVVKYFENIKQYMGYLGYLLMRLEDNEMFEIVSKAILYQMSAPDRMKGAGAAQLRYVLSAAFPVIYQTVVRMLALADSIRFPTFLEIALLLASDSSENCITMLKENILENIFYRFNPYFPERPLPEYDINPADPQDSNVKLGDSSIHLQITLSLLLIILKTLKDYLDENPNSRIQFPCPDAYSQSCFIWAFRYECLARDHQEERMSMTVIAATLLHCFGDKMSAFCTCLMPDVLSLAVWTEVPRRSDWVGRVSFNTSQTHVQFKSLLIRFSVDFIKVFKHNSIFVESRLWLLGIMYMIDPGLCHLRTKWSPALFSELRKTALQALVIVIPHIPPRLAVEYGMIRRILWYIEWYSESPFELQILYWCVRLLQVIVENRDKSQRHSSLTDLFDTHGIIILMHLSYGLLHKKHPPIEKAQLILSLNLRLLTSAVDVKRKISCCVYPAVPWPASVGGLVKTMLSIVLWAFENHYIINDRWMVALLDFIWEAIIWNAEYRAVFISQNGIYKLLDIITVTRPSVQCLTLALICDITRAGKAVGQLVSWRANIGAEYACPKVVARGATIAALLAAIFRDECNKSGVKLDDNGIIQDLDFPIMSAEVRKAIQDFKFREENCFRRMSCYSVADVGGSRLSKVFALLHLLSEDLNYTVSLADEAYNMYKNINLSPTDEATLLLCSHYLTFKLNEVWVETQLQCQKFLPQDQYLLDEFLHIGSGWAKDVKSQQEHVIEKNKIKESEEESSLYAFLARVRLNISLDALRAVKCIARSADRARITNALILDAVLAHHRRSHCARKMETPLLRTYGPMLDDQNITGQYVKVQSILYKN